MGRAWRERGRQATGRDELICSFSRMECTGVEARHQDRHHGVFRAGLFLPS